MVKKEVSGPGLQTQDLRSLLVYSSLFCAVFSLYLHLLQWWSDEKNCDNFEWFKILPIFGFPTFSCLFLWPQFLGLELNFEGCRADIYVINP
jgi:hypothetical protein